MGTRKVAPADPKTSEASGFVEFIGRLKETQTLLAVARALSLATPVDEAMRAVAREVAVAFGADMVAAYVVDQPTGSLVPAGAYQVPDDLVDFFRDTAFQIDASQALCRSWTTRKPVWTSSAAVEPGWLSEVRTLPDHSVVIAPTLARGEIVGALLVVWWTPGRTFSADELRLIEGVTAQVGLALENAELARQTQQRLREAEILADVAKSVNSSLDLDQVLARVVESARELIRSDIAHIALRDAERDRLVLRHRAGTRAPDGERVEIERGRGVSGQVWATGQPVRSADRRRDPRFAGEPIAPGLDGGIVASMAVPIAIEGGVEGVVFVADRAPRVFTDAEERTLGRLAEHAAVAIRNANVYDEMRRAREFLESVADNTADVIIRLDAGGHITYLSPGSERLFGVGRDAMMGRAVAELLRGGREEARAVMQRLLDEGRVRDYETVLRLADGRLVDTSSSFSLIRDETGAPVATVGIVRDITERKRLEDQLRQSQKMEAVGQLAGGIAHDFNNLLTVITGRSELLLQRLREDDPLRRDVGLIKSTGDRAATLTRQLLAFSRKQVLQPKVVVINAIVGEVTPMLQRLIGEHIALTTALEPELGRVKADPAQLEQVIVNLAVNARDAMPHGGRLLLRTANVELDAGFAAVHSGARAGAYVALTVSDTGSGMEPAVQARIFEPFFTTKAPGKGTGLGLAMVYGIVKQHDGYITVESAPGHGSAFTIYLRRVEDEPVAEATAPVPARASGRGTILLVEDEAGVRALASEILLSSGYDVLPAGGPVQALRVCEEHAGPISLLVTDVIMPEMSGRTLAHRLLRAQPGMKVLYMSGYAEDAIVHHGVLDPGITLLPKPFTPEALRRAVLDTLERGDR